MERHIRHKAPFSTPYCTVLLKRTHCVGHTFADPSIPVVTKVVTKTMDWWSLEFSVNPAKYQPWYALHRLQLLVCVSLTWELFQMLKKQNLTSPYQLAMLNCCKVTPAAAAVPLSHLLWSKHAMATFFYCLGRSFLMLVAFVCLLYMIHSKDNSLEVSIAHSLLAVILTPHPPPLTIWPGWMAF